MSPRAVGGPLPRPRSVIAAFLGDLAVVAAFVIIGRRSHHLHAGVADFVRVAWPFAAGLAVGWVSTRLDRDPFGFGRAAGAWLVTVAVGMTLRIIVHDHAFMPAFTIVTACFLGAGMLGWRAVARVVSRRRSAALAR